MEWDTDSLGVKSWRPTGWTDSWERFGCIGDWSMQVIEYAFGTKLVLAGGSLRTQRNQEGGRPTMRLAQRFVRGDKHGIHYAVSIFIATAVLAVGSRAS